MNWFARLLKREPARIPESLWKLTLSRLPFLGHLSDKDLLRLKGLAETLLDTKPMSGRGIEVSDEIAALVATQACLLVLNLDLSLYRHMSAVIVYPGSFRVLQREVDAAGVVHEWQEELAGEAMEHGGAVVLSWDELQYEHETGAPHNIVIHEFAHKLDMGPGAANGCPPFLPGFHRDRDLAAWPKAFTAAYRDFSARVDAVEARLPEDFDVALDEHADLYDELCADLPLDPYAARDPAEFFAVSSESFFTCPVPLAENYPQVYHLLSLYYRQDPLAPA